MNFWSALQNEEEQLTENSAIGYKSTGSQLLNLNFIIPSLRKASQNKIMNLFIRAYQEDKMLAAKWLFYARDIRGGLGERRLFRMIINALPQNKDFNIEELLPLIPEYGRYDDILSLVDTSAEKVVLSFIKKQLVSDLGNWITGEPISLLAKWLPSTHASNKEKVRLGKKIAKGLYRTEKAYRHTLSDLRKALDVVELKMSKNQWGEIKYESVPSLANLKYSRAFLRHDEARRLKYLEALKKGETKINAGVLTPADIVNRYAMGEPGVRDYDETLEQLWKALPDKVNGESNSIVVADGSGSMLRNIPGTRTMALAVANALAVYFAERSEGIYKNRYITFSENPQFVDFSGITSLHDKLEMALEHDEMTNTNVEKVFDLILKAAISNKAQQSDMPQNIIIVSDMEFDQGVYNPRVNLFESIQSKYKDAGYKLPRLVYWNVNSRTNAIPLQQNDKGLCFVSGYSVNILDMVLSGQIDPYQAMVDVLNSDRYKPVEAVLHNYEGSVDGQHKSSSAL